MQLLIRNGIVVDPAAETEEKRDIRIDGGRVAEIGFRLPAGDSRMIDADGCLVMPGFIDMHVHLRDPGQEYKEDIATGAAAAAHGGFTAVVAMPNTKPVIDGPEGVEYVQKKAASVSKIRILQAGAVTKGQEGRELADIAGMKKAGSPAVSEDGKSVMDAQVCREGMKLAAQNGMLFLDHCEDRNLVDGGVMNADENARRLGLRGITNAVEDVIAARDILLAKETGVHLHLCHCSTRDSVKMVRLAKEAGIAVTAEVCPHHFTLCSDDIPGDDAAYKMNPPLRAREDRDALREGLRDGTMDVISTDHAPHAAEEKNQSMAQAPFGIVGLETAAALAYTELVRSGILTLPQMAQKMSLNPARILGLDRGQIAEGKAADLVIFDVREPYRIDPETFLSKGRNTPFAGREVWGKVRMTVADGEIAYSDGTFLS